MVSCILRQFDASPYHQKQTGRHCDNRIVQESTGDRSVSKPRENVIHYLGF